MLESSHSTIERKTYRTLSKTNISPEKSILKMIFLVQRWDMLVPQRVFIFTTKNAEGKPECQGVWICTLPIQATTETVRGKHLRPQRRNTTFFQKLQYHGLYSKLGVRTPMPSKVKISPLWPSESRRLWVSQKMCKRWAAGLMFSGAKIFHSWRSHLWRSSFRLTCMFRMEYTRKMYRRYSQGFLDTTKASKHLFLPHEQFLY